MNILKKQFNSVTKTVPLDSVVMSWISGGTPFRDTADYWGGNIPWLTVKDFPTSSLITTSSEYVTAEGLKSYGGKLIPKGSIITAIRVGVGRNFISTIDTAINQDLRGIIPNQKVVSKYLLYVLNCQSDCLTRLSSGTTVKGIRQDDLKNIPIPLVPLEAQRRISEALSSVEEAIGATCKLISRARFLKNLLMRDLFEYKNKIPAASGTSINVKIVPLSNLAKIQTGIAKNSRIQGPGTVELPYLRVANVQDGSLDLREIKKISIVCHDIQRFLLQKDDVLLTEGGDHDKLGRGFIWNGEIDPCAHQNHIFAVRTDKLLLPKYLTYFVQSPYAKRYFLRVAIRTTNLASINAQKLKELPVILPSLSRQREVVATLEEIDKVLEVNDRTRVRWEALKAGILRELNSLLP